MLRPEHFDMWEFDDYRRPIPKYKNGVRAERFNRIENVTGRSNQVDWSLE